MKDLKADFVSKFLETVQKFNNDITKYFTLNNTI